MAPIRIDASEPRAHEQGAPRRRPGVMAAGRAGPEHQRRHQPLARGAVELHADGVEKEDERERDDRDGLERRIVRVDVDEAQAALGPSRNPRARKMIGKEIGARSTHPDVSPAMTRTIPIRPSAVSRSGTGGSYGDSGEVRDSAGPLEASRAVTRRALPPGSATPSSSRSARRRPAATTGFRP